MFDLQWNVPLGKWKLRRSNPTNQQSIVVHFKIVKWCWNGPTLTNYMRLMLHHHWMKSKWVFEKQFPYYYSPMIKTSIVDWNWLWKLWNINHVCLVLVILHIAIFVHVYLSKRLKKSKLLYKYYTLKYCNWVHIQYITTFVLGLTKKKC
jgi:hypothetical protein